MSTRPYRTFVFRQMPFCLCNTPTAFQRCMMSILSDVLKKTYRMDNFQFMVICKLIVCRIWNLRSKDARRRTWFSIGRNAALW